MYADLQLKLPEKINMIHLCDWNKNNYFELYWVWE